MKQLKQIGGNMMTTTKKLFVPKYNYVNRYTRAGVNGKWIKCPNCLQTSKVFHFSWSALTCQCCRESVEKHDWRLV